MCWRTIIKEINSISNNYILAVSGGVDSIFMLNFFKKTNVNVHIAHFDHGLRTREEAEREASLVKSLAIENNMTFDIGFGVNIRDAEGGTECEARNQRYAFLRSIKEKYNSNYICTAHHQDDNISNILLRLMRGHAHDNLLIQKLNGDLYRPFIDVSKQKIIETSRSRKYVWIDDPSNECLDYDRNWINKTVIPLLSERTNIKKAMIKGINKTNAKRFI